MIVVDGHLDLAMNAVQLNRDLQTSVHTIRCNELGIAGPGRARGAVALPEMTRGRVAVSLVSIFARCSGQPVPHRDFASATQAYAVARGHLAYYRGLESEGRGRVLSDRESLAGHIEEWREWDALDGVESSPPLGFVIALEGADPLLTPESLEEWQAAGLRVASLCHDGMGRYAAGSGSELGVTPLGVRLLSAMTRLGVALDLSHASDRTFDEALELHPGPVLASHSNCRHLVPHPRLLDDRQLSLLAERDGVAGISLTAWQLRPDHRSGRRDAGRAGLADFVDHVDHVCQVTGSCLHVGLGSNLAAVMDEDFPVGVDTVADLQAIAGALAGRGYSDADVESVMNGNWLRLLERVLPERAA